jgi:hypothetical protein
MNNTETVTAAIMSDPEYSSIAMVERRRWIVALSNGRRRYTTSRREAIEWCAEMGVPYVIAAPVRSR